MLPASEWIVHDWRISAMSSKPHCVIRPPKLLTEICGWHDVDNAKMLRRLFALELYVKLLPHSTVSAIATDYISCTEDLVIGIIYQHRFVSSDHEQRMTPRLIPSSKSHRIMTCTG